MSRSKTGRRMPDVLKGNQGFTLIEVLAACLVFAVCAVPLVHILTQGNQLAINSAKKTIALSIAQERMEEFIAQGAVKAEDGGTFEVSAEGYSGTVSLSPYLNLTLVTVNVTYQLSGGEAHVQLNSLLPQEE